ncbi:MAG: hypothetical protein AAFX00_13315 [Pseudomonadota bacterium]
MRLAKQGYGDPFRHFKVGFRVDGSYTESIERVLGSGMTQQNQSDWFMKNKRGMVVEGTVAKDTHVARFWAGNHDIFNESAVCISRNFFGGTAFPLRGTYHNYMHTGPTSDSEFARLWAVNLSGMNGFDTEQRQLNVSKNRVWRPGEKAFQAIGADRLIGYIEFRKLGAGQEGGWTFDIKPGTEWKFLNAGSEAQKQYCRDELAAWTGCHFVPGAFDFAT